MNDKAEQKADRFKTGISVLIALVSVCGALVAWLMAQAAGDAGGADGAAVQASLQAEKAYTGAAAQVYSDLDAYITYKRYSELQKAAEEALAGASGEEAAALERQAREASDIAIGLQDTFFDTRYLKPDGGYDAERQIGELRAEAERDSDADPAPHLERADQLKDEARWLAGILVGLAASVWLYTLGRGLTATYRYIPAVAGLVVMACSFAAVAIVELTL